MSETQQLQYRNPVQALGFSILPHAAMLDNRVSDGALRTFLVYVMHAQQKDRSWPSRETVAELRGKSVAAITRHNQELEEAGYITRDRRFGMTSMTWMENLDANQELVRIATEILDDREGLKNEPSNGSKMSRATAQKRAAEEEQYKNNKEEKQNRRESSRLYWVFDVQEMMGLGERVAGCPECGETNIEIGTENCPVCKLRLFWMDGLLKAADRRAIKALDTPDLKPKDVYEARIIQIWGVDGMWTDERIMRRFRRVKATMQNKGMMTYMNGKIKWGKGKGVPLENVLNAIERQANQKKWALRQDEKTSDNGHGAPEGVEPDPENVVTAEEKEQLLREAGIIK